MTIIPSTAAMNFITCLDVRSLSHARGEHLQIVWGPTPTLAQGCPRSPSLGAASRRFAPPGHPAPRSGRRRSLRQIDRDAIRPLGRDDDALPAFAELRMTEHELV